MNRDAPYDRALRAIGQALEGQDFEILDVKSSGEKYIVSGNPSKVSALQALKAKWQGRRLKRGAAFQASYTLDDIAKLDFYGRKRRGAAKKNPEFQNLSTFLRTIGTYLDMKGARLLQVNKSGNKVTIVYQAEHGHPDIEERTVASFRYLFSEMHRRRKKTN